jgi:hypothetical protein
VDVDDVVRLLVLHAGRCITFPRPSKPVARLRREKLDVELALAEPIVGDRRCVSALYLLAETSTFEAVAKRDISSRQPERHRYIGIVRHEWDKPRRASKRMPREQAMRPTTDHDDVR